MHSTRKRLYMPESETTLDPAELAAITHRRPDLFPGLPSLLY